MNAFSIVVAVSSLTVAIAGWGFLGAMTWFFAFAVIQSAWVTMRGNGTYAVGDAEGATDDYSSNKTVYNPATGLPMISGYGGVDVGGNCYGCDNTDFGNSHNTFNE